MGTGSAESNASIDALLGFNFTQVGYEDFARVLGMKEQDNSLYDGIAHEKLVNVDISLDDIIAKMSLTGAEMVPSVSAPDVEGLLRDISSLNTRQQWGIRHMMRALLNFSAKLSDAQLALFLKNPEPTLQERFLSIVLYERNAPVVEYIRSHPEENIAIVYGALHYDGIVSELMAQDASWKIISVEPFFPYSQ